MNNDEPSLLTKDQITNIISKVFFTQPGSGGIRRNYYVGINNKTRIASSRRLIFEMRTELENVKIRPSKINKLIEHLQRLLYRSFCEMNTQIGLMSAETITATATQTVLNSFRSTERVSVQDKINEMGRLFAAQTRQHAEMNIHYYQKMDPFSVQQLGIKFKEISIYNLADRVVIEKAIDCLTDEDIEFIDKFMEIFEYNPRDFNIDTEEAQQTSIIILEFSLSKLIKNNLTIEKIRNKLVKINNLNEKNDLALFISSPTYLDVCKIYIIPIYSKVKLEEKYFDIDSIQTLTLRFLEGVIIHDIRKKHWGIDDIHNIETKITYFNNYFFNLSKEKKITIYTGEKKEIEKLKYELYSKCYDHITVNSKTIIVSSKYVSSEKFNFAGKVETKMVREYGFDNTQRMWDGIKISMISNFIKKLIGKDVLIYIPKIYNGIFIENCPDDLPTKMGNIITTLRRDEEMKYGIEFIKNLASQDSHISNIDMIKKLNIDIEDVRYCYTITFGSNLRKVYEKYLDIVDPSRSKTNELKQMYEIYGITVASEILMRELIILTGGERDNKIDRRHLDLLVLHMTKTGKIISASKPDDEDIANGEENTEELDEKKEDEEEVEDAEEGIEIHEDEEVHGKSLESAFVSQPIKKFIRGAERKETSNVRNSAIISQMSGVTPELGVVVTKMLFSSDLEESYKSQIEHPREIIVSIPTVSRSTGIKIEPITKADYRRDRSFKIVESGEVKIEKTEVEYIPIQPPTIPISIFDPPPYYLEVEKYMKEIKLVKRDLTKIIGFDIEIVQNRSYTQVGIDFEQFDNLFS